MKFSFGGSAKKWWQGLEEGLRGGAGRSGGELGKLTSTLKQGSDYITDADYIGGSVGDTLFHRSGSNKFNAGLANLDRSTMGWSRQLSPLWEGGVTESGGTFQDIFGTEEEGGLIAGWGKKARHHVFGDDYGSGGDGGSGGDTPVVASDTEDPSLINQSNWERPGAILSLKRRLQRQQRGGLSTDLVKTKRGRLSAANLS